MKTATQNQTVTICGERVKMHRAASFNFGPFDYSVIYGGVGHRMGYLVCASHGVTRELVFVWDSTRPATPVYPAQLEDAPCVQRVIAKYYPAQVA